MKQPEKIILPKPNLKGAMSVEECIQKRRSVRSFSSKPLAAEEVSQLLWATQGITDARRGLRAAPSAGALYPLEIYLVKGDGVFYYDIENHAIIKNSGGDMRSALSGAALGQASIKEAPASIVICAVRSRTTAKYGGRGNRYVEIEAGHAAENLHLQAVALGLASVPVGAFDDNQVKKVLNLPSGTEPLYIIPAGHPKTPF
ncbi:MAG: SagB/ThcOx family dehydrogenase [Candidatus Omnitrophica bacterium]|nr:SagB/ThcOx family dehydrogenase [Candidatus Omnitrophota bacterium]MBU4488749.1 SagB/ThcOx family dehydrogenase [Candidatus Omnitrophota bacterium]